MAEKKRIYYARTYRHLKYHIGGGILYLLLLVLPCLLLFSFNLHTISRFISELGIHLLVRIFPGMDLYTRVDTFSIIGEIEYIMLPVKYPDRQMVLANFCITGGIIYFLGTGKRKGKPISIYFMLSLLVHMINCCFFLFASEYFPYTTSDFSELYMKQQIGIWLTFIILAGAVTGFLGGKGYRYKLTAFVGILMYSFVFGIIRYILFLYLLLQYSMLYMALMFFVFGPLFDFVYLVGIYALFVNRMMKYYDSGSGREEWEWS